MSGFHYPNWTKSVRNRCLIKIFGGVYVLSLFGFFFGCKGFCHKTESDLFILLSIKQYIESMCFSYISSRKIFMWNRVTHPTSFKSSDSADSSQAPGLTSGLQGSVNVHRGALLLVPQWQCISSFVFYILIKFYEIRIWCHNLYQSLQNESFYLLRPLSIYRTTPIFSGNRDWQLGQYVP